MTSPSNLLYVKGDLTTIDVQYRAHQCNCVSNYALGVAKSIFEKYPEANTYNKEFTRKMGTISIHNSVINMYAQCYPGKAKSHNDT